MDVGLGWLGVGVGAVGSAAMYLLARASAAGEVAAEARREARLAAGLTAVLTLVFWGIGMQTRPPYSPGQALAWGFLIGGLLGALVCLASARLGALSASGTVRTGYLASASTAFFALFGTSLTYVIFHGYPQPPLIGFAIGAAMAAILARSITSESSLYAGMWAVFATLISAGTVLAVLHFDVLTERIWWPVPILISASACVVSYVGMEIGSLRRLHTRPGASLALSVLVGSALMLLLATVYAWRVAADWALLGAVGVGVIVGALVLWIAAGVARSRDPLFGVESSAAMAILVVALAVAAFKLWGGLGIALALLGMLPAVIPPFALAERGDSVPFARAAMVGALLFGLSILLFRLFIEYYRSDVGGTDIRIHYTFIGALIGAILPFLLASSLARSGGQGDIRRLGGTAVVGLVAAATPLVLLVVWEIRSVMGLLFGLAAAAAVVLLLRPVLSPPRPEPDDAEEAHRLREFASAGNFVPIIGAQLIAVQFSGPLAELDLTRTTRIWVLAGAMLIGLIWLVLGGLFSARGSR